MSELKILYYYEGRPVDELSREELLGALNEVARELMHAREEMNKVRPYIDYAAMLTAKVAP